MTSLAARVQHRLMDYYGLETFPCVDSFLVLGQERERLIVCLKDDAVELALQLPTAATGACGPVGLDGLCQLIEGVSHFVLVAERARRDSCESVAEPRGVRSRWALVAGRSRILSARRGRAGLQGLAQRVPAGRVGG